MNRIGDDVAKHLLFGAFASSRFLHAVGLTRLVNKYR